MDNCGAFIAVQGFMSKGQAGDNRAGGNVMGMHGINNAYKEVAVSQAMDAAKNDPGDLEYVLEQLFDRAWFAGHQTGSTETLEHV